MHVMVCKLRHKDGWVGVFNNNVGGQIMSDDIRFMKELPLLPDSELLRLANEFQSQTGRKERSEDRASRRQDLARREEALYRELKARGIGCPPWWAKMS